MKLKLRATYPKEIRSQAKAEKKGVATISIEFPNGDRMEAQAPVDHVDCEFLKWAMAMAFCDEIRQYPELHDMIQDLVERKHDSQAQEEEGSSPQGSPG